MRITNNMLVNNLLSNVNKNLVNMAKKQDELATGKKVQAASDDPVAASKIIKYKTDLAEYAQYERNTNDALSWLETTESTMMDINKVLQRAREIAVKAANGTNADEDIKKIGDELSQLKKQIIMDGNFSFAGRYIFSGYHTEEKLFNDDGTYSVGMTDIDLKNPPIKEYQIGVGEDIQISTNGLDLFGSVLDEGPFVDKMPNALSLNESTAKHSVATINLDLNLDHTLGATSQITYNIAGKDYDVDMTSLDLSAVDLSNPVEVENAKITVLNAMKNAVLNPPGATGSTMSDVANIGFNEDNQLVITAKELGEIAITQSSADGLKDVDAAGSVVDSFIDYEVGDKLASSSKQSELSLKFDPTIDHSVGATAQITYEINGVNYDLDMTKLDLSSTDPDDSTSVENAKNKLINAIKNAGAQAAVPPVVPNPKISDVADVYFSESDEIVIRTKEYGAVTISQTSAVGLKDKDLAGLTIEGQIVASIGNSTKEATLSTGVIIDSDVGTNFNDKEFVLTLNGETHRIKIDTLPSPASVADLVDTLQSSIDKKFTNDEIKVTESAGIITFSTNNVTKDGEFPSLEIRPVKSTKSSMIQDFDDVIAAIESGDREVVSDFIAKMDKNMQKVLTNLSDIGARTNRMELVISRINENSVTFTKLLSNAQDADMSEVIMYLKNSENVYNASLATGAKVIQPTLIDFLR